MFSINKPKWRSFAQLEIKHQFENHLQQNDGSNVGIFGMIGGGMALLAACVSLYNGKETRADNERQREHERDMAQRAETNPNITVHTGRVRHDHNLHGFSGLDSDTVSRMASSGIQAINASD